MSSKSRCPQCDGDRKPAAENRAYPFCGERCKMLDLHSWLSGEYRIPVGADASERNLPGSDELAAARLAARMDEGLIN
ncbi:MAG: DNA gyrase inhibitor YacG [Myxococcales bacterium]|nr:DNA gyrase inhibitor YacG [Myxococcales bacterium]